MKKYISIALLLLMIFSIFTLSSCKKNEVPQGMKIAYREDALYKLYVPSSWRIDNSSEDVSAYDSTSNQISVTVNVYDNKENKDIEEYWESYIPNFTEIYKEFTIVSKNKITVDNATAMEFVFTGKLEYADKSSSFDYTIVQYIASHANKFFIVTFSTLTSAYEKNTATIKKIIDNFKFNDEPGEYVKDPKEAKEAPSGYKYISNKVVDYDFYIPNAWIQDKDTGVLTAYATNGIDKTSVNVTGWDVSYMVNVVTDWRESFTKDMSLVSSDFTDVSTTETTLDGIKAYRYESTATVSGQALKYVQVACARNYMIYLITYTATPEYFDLHINEFEKMVEYFSFN